MDIVMADTVILDAVQTLESIVSRPVGDDPATLRRLDPSFGIWDAYAVSQLIMPDGLVRLDGEAVAEVLRCLPRRLSLA
jgi:hypothetical protein